MAINRAQLVKELVPGLHALFGLEYEKYNNEHEDIFDTESSERAFEEEVMLSDLVKHRLKEREPQSFMTQLKNPGHLVTLMKQSH